MWCKSTIIERWTSLKLFLGTQINNDIKNNLHYHQHQEGAANLLLAVYLTVLAAENTSYEDQILKEPKTRSSLPPNDTD